ncbi:MAG: hypothetical protein ACREJ3_06865 [Polyangiaceae bacterium]
MSTINQTTKQAHDAQVIVGVQKNMQNVPSLQIMGKAYTMAEAIKLIQSRIDAVNAAGSARANWHDATATYKALNAQVTQVVRGLRLYALNAFGQNSPVLADFGFTPPKKATLTPEQQVARAAKAAATRKARGTMGTKQRLPLRRGTRGIPLKFALRAASAASR